MKNIIVNFSILFSILTSCNLAPGSFPYVETYAVKLREEELIKKIENFKIKNPQYSVPDNFNLVDGRKDENGFWYMVYFYYPDKNQVVHTWVRESSDGYSTFALVSIKKGLKPGNWKRINKDLPESENIQEKKNFEVTILNKIIH